MTVIIGYVDKKRKSTYMASDRCISSPYKKYNIEDSKIYQPKENKNFLIGISGDIRVLQLIKSFITFSSEEDLNEDNIIIDDKYIIKNVIPAIQKVCLNNNYPISKLESISILFSYKDKLWLIGNNLALLSNSDNTDFLCIGSGELFAKGVLEAIKNESYHILIKIFKALEISCKLGIGCEGPYDVYDNSVTGKIFYEGDFDVKKLIDSIDNKIVIETVNNGYIKNIIEDNCNVKDIINLEKGKLHFITKNMKDIYFLDLDYKLGLLKSNGDIIKCDNLILMLNDDFLDNEWKIIEVNRECIDTLLLAKEHFNLIVTETDKS